MNHRMNQIEEIARLELKRYLLARRWIAIYFVAFAPVALLLLFGRMAPARFSPVEQLSQAYSMLYQLFMLRFGIFISCAVVLSQAFRGDILEKTLHFYLLTPARREVITIGKYVAGITFVTVVFSVSTIASHVLIYSGSPAFGAFFLEGPGFFHLIRYVIVTVLASVAYGAVFLLVGLFFKNPGVPAIFLLAWESLSFAFPSLLQLFTVIHYLQALLPVVIDRGPFAVVTAATSPILGIPLLVFGASALVATVGWFARHTEVTYSAD